MPGVDPAVVDALRFQRLAVDLPSLRSPLYAALLDAAIADAEAGGPCAAVLARVPAGLHPIDDAVTLRFLGGLHRLVLTGKAPELARWFPTAGGTADPADGDLHRIFLDTVAAHAEELVAALSQPVQTNEVGRCAALAVGFTALLRAHRLPLRLVEVGTSAGLNLRWDRWRYDTGASAWGDPDAPLCFDGDTYREPVPDLSAPLGPGEAVAERWGCDRSPIDPTTPEGALLLRSFVWPDQSLRHAQLDVAIETAASVPATVVAADAADFVAERLADPAPGRTTVVFHSIVWQYLSEDTRRGMTAALREATAGPDAPVAWLRLEPGADPAGPAELRLTTWSGGEPEERLLALSGYHRGPVFLPG